MSDRLDELVARLAGSPTDRSLEELEAELGRSIALRRREARAVSLMAPVRFASIGLALAMGVTAGAAAATATVIASHPYSAFSSGAHLAPSSLLEGGR
jgi:hypothetical protein